MFDPFTYVDPNSYFDRSTIEAGSMTLLRQAPMTADEYMRIAIECIDHRFDKGYAAKHPELVGAFIQAAAMDMGAAVIARAIETLAKAQGETR